MDLAFLGAGTPCCAEHHVPAPVVLMSAEGKDKRGRPVERRLVHSQSTPSLPYTIETETTCTQRVKVYWPRQAWEDRVHALVYRSDCTAAQARRRLRRWRRDGHISKRQLDGGLYSLDVLEKEREREARRERKKREAEAA